MALTDKLSAIADALRSKTGGTGKLTLDQIATGISGLDTSGSGGSTAPANATSWYVGEWAAGGTGTTASKSRCNYSKKMASGVTITNNMNTDICVNAAYMQAGSGSSSDSVSSVSATQTITKNGGTYTFTNTSAKYIYINLWEQISVLGSPLELQLNTKMLFDIANKVTITGTEVS